MCNNNSCGCNTSDLILQHITITSCGNVFEAVSWASKRQATAAASTMGAECQACGGTARDGLLLINALRDFSLVSTDVPLQGSVVIECDNNVSILLRKDYKEGQRVKQIDIIHHFARDHLASGELS
jgi:hypothetical protein